MKLTGAHGWRLGEAPRLPREDLRLQAAQALRWAAARAAGYSLAMLGCSAHEMPLPSSSSVAPIGRLHLETTRERLNDPGPCHTVASNSYLQVAEGRAHVSTHGLTTHGALHASPFLLCDRRVRKRRVENPAKRWGRGQEEKSGQQAPHSPYVQQLLSNNFDHVTTFGCCRTWQNNGTTSACISPTPPNFSLLPPQHRNGCRFLIGMDCGERKPRASIQPISTGPGWTISWRSVARSTHAHAHAYVYMCHIASAATNRG